MSDWFAEAEYLIAGWLTVFFRQTQLEWIISIVERAQDAAFKQRRERTRAFRRSPQVGLKRHAFRLENMVIKHVAHGTSPLPFVGGEHVVEFQHAGHQAHKEVAHSRITDAANALAENRQGEQLTRIEHLMPIAIVITKGLVRIYAGADRDKRI